MTDPLFLLADETSSPLDDLQAGELMTLPADVRRHAIQAMRLGRGDGLQLSDGRGLRIHATVSVPESGQVLVDSSQREPEPPVRLTLAQALAKSGDDEQAVDTAVQLGVGCVIPWQAERSIARFKLGRTERRWQATLLAASEQSRRTWLPRLDPWVRGTQIAERCAAVEAHGGLAIVLHQDADRSWTETQARALEVARRASRTPGAHTPCDILVAVGPEGGISDHEVQALEQAGALITRLGDAILRAAVAGPVALTLLRNALGGFAA